MSYDYEQIDGLDTKAYEETLLSMLIRDGSCFDEISEIINEDTFSEQWHKDAFKSIKELVTNNNKVSRGSIILVANKYNFEIIEKNLEDLEQNPLSTLHLKTYAGLLQDACMRRAMKKESLATIGLCDKPQGLKYEEIANMNQAQFFKLQSMGVSTINNPQNSEESVKTLLDLIEKNKSNEFYGVKAGFREIDEFPITFKPKNFIVIGGRAGMGKTAFSLQLLINFIYNKKNVLFLSIEMPKEEITARLIGILSDIPFDNVLSGNYSNYEDKLMQLAHATKIVKQSMNFYLHDGSMNLMIIRNKILYVSRELLKLNKKLDLVIVDYLQIIDPVISMGANKTAELDAISSGLAKLARDFDLPVIALAQLNRNVEHRENKEPVMSDLKGCGTIEQDANCIMMLYREEYYNKETPKKNVMTVNIIKNRAGRTGAVALGFKAEKGLFEIQENRNKKLQNIFKRD
jgi:replicative DNA helicase